MPEMEKMETQLFSYELDVIRPSQFDPAIHPSTGMQTARSPIINLFCRGLNDDPVPSVMLRVHGFYPYLFVEVPSGQSPAVLVGHLSRLIELAFLNYQAKVVEEISCAVHEIYVVRGVPFLGYHKADYFLKIFLTEWNLVRIAANMLRTGKCGRRYHVFETHISEFFKFVVDGHISCDRLVVKAQRSERAVSTCDYEFDTIWKCFEPNRVENGKLDGRRLHISEAEMTQHFEERQEHIEKLLSQETYTESDNMEEVAQLSEMEEIPQDNDFESLEPTESLEQHPNNITNNNLANSLTGLDGGGNDVRDQSDDEEQSFSLYEGSLETRPDSLQHIRYSKTSDIPDISFYWAGTCYCFDRETGLLSDILYADLKPQPYTKPQFVFENDANNMHGRTNTKDSNMANEILAQQYLLLSQEEEHSEVDYRHIMHIEYSDVFEMVYYVFYTTHDLYAEQSQQIDIAEHLRFGIVNFEGKYRFEENEVKDALSDIIGFEQGNFYDYKSIEKKEALTQYLPYIIQEIDPDIIFSWKIEHSGIARIATEAGRFNFDFLTAIGRVPGRESLWFQKINEEFDAYEYLSQNSPWQNKFSASKIFAGRVYLGVWNVCKHYMKASDSGIEYFDTVINKEESSIADFEDIAHYFYNSKVQKKVDENFIEIVEVVANGNIRVGIRDILHNAFKTIFAEARLIESSGYIIKAEESAKLFEIPFYEATSRGSEFKTESLLFQLAREQDYIVGPSPSNEEISRMHASEFLPLVMEPLSGYYTSPLLVFDFVSLYPSIMAAYNVCYCTLLRDFTAVQRLGPHEMQFYQRDLEDIADDDLIYSPAGNLEVKSHIRRGVFAQVMENGMEAREKLVTQQNRYQKELEILEQYAQKTNANNRRVLSRIEYLLREISKLHSRQLELKLMMNSTYGYMAAAFSGRMPVIEAGDTVLQGSREILEYTIKLVELQFPGLKVVYADTDSLFVNTSGLLRQLRSMSDAELLLLANSVGMQILEAINEQMQPPVQVKFERVYFPLILLGKKRYAGRSYNPSVLLEIESKLPRELLVPDSEFLDDMENITRSNVVLSQFPSTIDVKGIESIRRDTPLVVEKTIEAVLETLFSTGDLSAVKICIVEGIIRLIRTPEGPDFIIRNMIHPRQFDGELEKKLASGSLPYFMRDEGGEYTFSCMCDIFNYKTEAVHRVTDFAEVFSDGSHLRVNVVYYLERKLIPSLQRLLGLCGLNVEDIYLATMRQLCKKPRMEWLMVNFQRLSKYSEMPEFYNVNTSQHIAEYARFDPDLFEMNCVVAERFQHGRESIYLRSAPPPTHDIRLQRPMRECICCRSEGVLHSKQISICKVCLREWGVLQHWKAHFSRMLWRTSRICEECAGDSCTGENCGRLCKNWRCPVLWGASRFRSLVLQLDNAIEALSTVE